MNPVLDKKRSGKRFKKNKKKHINKQQSEILIPKVEKKPILTYTFANKSRQAIVPL